MLANLCLNKLNCLLDLVQDSSLKGNIFDDVHLCAHLLINTLVSDETSAGPGEELLGILAEKKNTSGAHLLFTIDLRSSLLTLGRADASIALLSLNRNLLVGLRNLTALGTFNSKLVALSPHVHARNNHSERCKFYTSASQCRVSLAAVDGLADSENHAPTGSDA